MQHCLFRYHRPVRLVQVALRHFANTKRLDNNQSISPDDQKPIWHQHGLARPLLPSTDGFQKRNILLMGPPGSGKTMVGRELARLIDKPLIDIDDDWLEPRWETSVAAKLADLGDDAFVEAEGRELLAFDRHDHIVSLSGSNPMHPRSMEHLSRNGIFVYLDTRRETILDRCEMMRIDRIVGQRTNSLDDILAWREHFYENSYDIRVIVTENDTPAEIAEKIQKQLEQQSQFYESTRSGNQTGQQFLDVVQQGLALDGGLFVSRSFSPMSLDELARLLNLPYPEIALRVMERFPLGTLHPSHLRSLLWQAYSTFKRTTLPVRHLQRNQYLMETFHGPTASFKDLSLQLLPRLMQAASELNKKNTSRLGLLVATSGDTGCAALDAFARLPGTPVIVLYPTNGVSIVQKAQMQTAEGDVCVLGVDGDFDFCQTTVKELFGDRNFLSNVERLVPGLHLSSANSINWARFLPQVVFTISSYLQLIQQNVIALGQPVDVCIPTGNFGNMLGAVFARSLGLPVRRLITASNDNNVIADFIRTGSYDLRKRSFHKTITPSIDILVSSNLERFLYLLSDGNYELIRHLFNGLTTNRVFHVESGLLRRVQSEIQGDWASESECLATMKKVYNETQQLIDPHTAVAVHVADKFSKGDDHVPVLISATAHYGKFPQAVFQAVDNEQRLSSNNISTLLTDLQSLKSTSPMHHELLKLPAKQAIHTGTVPANKSAIVKEIETFLQTFAQRAS